MIRKKISDLRSDTFKFADCEQYSCSLYLHKEHKMRELSLILIIFR